MGFWPFVWLGDDQRGLMWFAESAAGWHSSETPIEVTRAGDVTQLIIHFVDRPETVTRKQLIFGLQAKPVKPIPAGWREWRVERVETRRSTTPRVEWEKDGLPIQWRMLSPLDGNKFSFRPATPRRCKRRALSAITRSRPTPREREPFADYMLYGIAQWVKQHGVDGVYFDGAGPPVPCANPLHGHGWLDANGKRQPTYAIFGLRDFYKRLWVMLSERVSEPVVWVHADGKMPAPCFSFVTANYEGEFVQGPQLAGDALLSDAAVGFLALARSGHTMGNCTDLAAETDAWPATGSPAKRHARHPTGAWYTLYKAGAV